MRLLPAFQSTASIAPTRLTMASCRRNDGGHTTLLANPKRKVSAAVDGRICSDTDDDKFLACALASGAGIIVSGDKHLLSVSGCSGIEVLRPRAFLERHLRR
jgi:predicted nucleic acid-binding protein